ncbi:hypothetical protein ACI8AC_20430 [Geodermatophilus sp. SYSU D00758]
MRSTTAGPARAGGTGTGARDEGASADLLVAEERPNPSGDLREVLDLGPVFRRTVAGYDRFQVDNYVRWAEEELAGLRREHDDLLDRYARLRADLDEARGLLRHSPGGQESVRVSTRIGSMLAAAADQADALRAEAEADRAAARAHAERTAAAAAAEADRRITAATAGAGRVLAAATAGAGRLAAAARRLLTEADRAAREARDEAAARLEEARAVRRCATEEAARLRQEAAADAALTRALAREEVVRMLTAARDARQRADEEAAAVRDRLDGEARARRTGRHARGEALGQRRAGEAGGG